MSVRDTLINFYHLVARNLLDGNMVEVRKKEKAKNGSAFWFS